MIDFTALRERMVEEQLLPRKITDPATLASMAEVPREEFVPDMQKPYAYEDGPLPIGEGQTISQPYIVALMTQSAQLQPQDQVLDIGTGSGYAAAVLSRIVDEVYTVERIPSLTQSATQAFQKLGYLNIHAHVSDGSMGWEEHAPYDAIIVTAGAPQVPLSLISQLKIGGRLVIPVGDSFGQRLLRLTRVSEEEVKEELLELVRFVPLIGEEGW